MSLTVVDL